MDASDTTTPPDGTSGGTSAGGGSGEGSGTSGGVHRSSGGGSAKASDEPRYTVDELARASRNLFGSDVSGHAVRGALAGDDRKSFTVAQATELVEDFRDRDEQSDEGAG